MYLLGLNNAKKISREKGKDLSVADSESHMYVCVCVCQCGCVCMYIYTYIGFPGGKESACQCRRSKRHRFIFWAWQPTPVFLLEIPVDRGAWLATVHRFAQSHP